ncbi:ImpA family type VI secretion system protein [Vibrio coralliilyticus]|uniref:type VI secretion system protein TssA n=1 Tax=Vibrio coralliilyticus TaxID=190893 RepID=UPI0017C4FB20|nr:type VI secretion system ImpA family N-terminal domain-containing protein [Vibrio coralliilyticus]NUW69223.1 type VI secretion system ImpA family N-terminal domain-containing protein [Vibrio coralliilyticus]
MNPLKELLTPISGDNPSGRYLKLERDEYRKLRNLYNISQSSFRELVETLEASQDLSLVEKNNKNWHALCNSLLEVMVNQTKDLELLCWYTVGQVFTSSPYQNLSTASTALVGFVELFWSTLNPCIPEEKIKSSNNIEMQKELVRFRLKPLYQLTGESQDSTALYAPLQMMKLVGDITYGDFVRAEKSGSLNELKDIVLSFNSVSVDETLKSLSKIYQDFGAAENVISAECQKVGISAVNFKFIKANIENLINAIRYLVGGVHILWPLDDNYNLITEENKLSTDTIKENSQTTNPLENVQQKNVVVAVEQHLTAANRIINDREQAFSELRKISAFFQRNEPHSPIPFLLGRAIRWGNMSLPELFDEMIGSDSNAMSQVRLLSGIDQEKLLALDAESDRGEPNLTLDVTDNVKQEDQFKW